MKALFKWWVALELCKLALISISLLLEERTTGTIFLFVLLFPLTVISYVKVWPLLKKITNKLFTEEDIKNRQLLSRARLTLFFLMILDLMPFLPGIQAILRYEYHRKSEQIENIIGF